jgi:hypothetical protein
MARRITAPLTAKVILNGGQRRDRTAAAALFWPGFVSGAYQYSL